MENGHLMTPLTGFHIFHILRFNNYGHIKLVCVFVQVVCRYLCEETDEKLTEKGFIPAVRSFALKLILAGNTG